MSKHQSNQTNVSRTYKMHYLTMNVTKNIIGEATATFYCHLGEQNPSHTLHLNKTDGRIIKGPQSTNIFTKIIVFHMTWDSGAYKDRSRSYFIAGSSIWTP